MSQVTYVLKCKLGHQLIYMYMVSQLACLWETVSSYEENDEDRLCIKLEKTFQIFSLSNFVKLDKILSNFVKFC